MPENTIISKTFTYDIADQYLYQTNNLKKTAEWTYTGPDKLWIFVDKSTMKIHSRFHYTERDNGHDVHCPVEQIKVLVDANVNPCLASLIHNELDYGTLPHTVENLPENTTYGHPIPIPPDHTYELIEIEYDQATGEFKKPYPWKKPHITWDELKASRRAMLEASDSKIRTCPPDQIPAWEAYRQKLRDLPTTFAGVDPWKVIFPAEPNVQPAGV